jgi:hypothetical protein
MPDDRQLLETAHLLGERLEILVVAPIGRPHQCSGIFDREMGVRKGEDEGTGSLARVRLRGAPRERSRKPGASTRAPGTSHRWAGGGRCMFGGRRMIDPPVRYRGKAAVASRSIAECSSPLRRERGHLAGLGLRVEAVHRGRRKAIERRLEEHAEPGLDFAFGRSQTADVGSHRKRFSPKRMKGRRESGPRARECRIPQRPFGEPP